MLAAGGISGGRKGRRLSKDLHFSVALGAAGSVGYYYSIYLPARDAQLDRDRKLEAVRAEYSRQAEQARLAAEKREAEDRLSAEKREAEERQAAAGEAVQLRYRTCIRIAEGNYSATWTQQCKKISDRASKDYKDCLSKGTFDKATCDTLYSERDASPDCALPRTIGTDISDILDKARRAFLDPSRLGTTLAAFAGKFGDGYTQRAAEAVKNLPQPELASSLRDGRGSGRIHSPRSCNRQDRRREKSFNDLQRRWRPV
jgi:hypothetical protein